LKENTLKNRKGPSELPKFYLL